MISASGVTRQLGGQWLSTIFVSLHLSLRCTWKRAFRTTGICGSQLGHHGHEGAHVSGLLWRRHWYTYESVLGGFKNKRMH